MSQILPSRLYKFYPDHNRVFSENFQIEELLKRKKALATPYFHCSSALELNDPFEFRMMIDDFKSPSEMYEFVDEYNKIEDQGQLTREQLQKAMDELGFEALKENFQEKIEDIKAHTLKNMRVTCFTERYNSILMWSHYANNHKGFCLRFDLGALGDIKDYLLRVSYSKNDKFPKIKPIDIVRNHKNAPQKTLEIMLSHKHCGWSYEKEWRVLYLEPLLHYGNGAVIEVLLGCNSSEELWTELKSYFPDAKFLKAKRAERNFQLVFNKL